jgi:NADPH:quinone reductase-like Zn-dependent oxidoreductase
MKAWRLTMASGSFGLEDVPDPAVREGAVVVRVHAMGQVLEPGEPLVR